MNAFAHADLGELKTIYRVLHQHLLEHPELMETQYLMDLQSWLQQIAGAQGVDVGDHAAWDAWLGQEHTPCDVRASERKVVSLR